MKRLVFLLMSIALVLVPFVTGCSKSTYPPNDPDGPGAPGPTPTPLSFPLNMDFQNYTGGILPPGTSASSSHKFYVWSSNPANNTYTSALGIGGKDASNISMKIQGTSGASYEYAWCFFATPDSMTGTWEMSCEVYFDEATLAIRRDLFMIRYTYNGGTKYFPTAQIRPDGVHYGDGTVNPSTNNPNIIKSTIFSTTFGTPLPNKWYKVRVVFNFTAHTYDSYLTNLTDDPLNEIKIFTNSQNIVSGAGVTYQLFAIRLEPTAASQSSITYIDNLKIEQQ